MANANVVCYFTSWTIYRPTHGKFSSANVDPSLCTHINYAFAGLGDDGSVKILDDWEANGLKELTHLRELKNKNPNLKLMLSMGGWNEGSSKYSNVASNSAKRSAMIKSVINFLKKYGFDGFDLDWEYPCQRGGKPQDKNNFIIWLSELKAALHEYGYLLSAAVAGGVTSIDLSYDVPKVSANLDMINIMAYDFHGAFEPFVGHLSPLYASHLDRTPEQKLLNVSSGVQHWLDLGADPRKINLGVGTYGRSFILANESNTDLYAPTLGGGKAGPYTQQDGILGYNEISEFCSKWRYVWDDEQKVPHKISGNQWVGYEDVNSIALKVNYAKSKRLGGMMVWSLDTDDFSGISSSETYPLLRTVNNIRKCERSSL